ncbi:unnamed protein product [Chrysoparadoxa australica]
MKADWADMLPWERKWFCMMLVVSISDVVGLSLSVIALSASVTLLQQLVWGVLGAGCAMSAAISANLAYEIVQNRSNNHRSLPYYRSLMAFRDAASFVQALFSGFLWLSGSPSPTFIIFLLAVSKGFLVVSVEQYQISLVDNSQTKTQRRMRFRHRQHAPNEVAAIIKVQARVRMILATTRIHRMNEFRCWEQHCGKTQRTMKVLFVLFLLIFSTATMFVNLAYCIVFDANTTRAWLLTVTTSVLLEIFLKQPVKLAVQHIAATTLRRIKGGSRKEVRRSTAHGGDAKSASQRSTGNEAATVMAPAHSGGVKKDSSSIRPAAQRITVITPTHRGPEDQGQVEGRGSSANRGTARGRIMSNEEHWHGGSDGLGQWQDKERGGAEGEMDKRSRRRREGGSAPPSRERRGRNRRVREAGRGERSLPELGF